jgi:hypothetical protein
MIETMGLGALGGLTAFGREIEGRPPSGTQGVAAAGEGVADASGPS